MALQKACGKTFGLEITNLQPSQGAMFIWTCDDAMVQINTLSFLSLSNGRSTDTLQMNVYSSNA